MINYKFEYEIGSRKEHTEGSLEIDETTWTKIEDICKERKWSIAFLIEYFLENLSPDQAEEILISWDM